jgi:hypothetical protein
MVRAFLTVLLVLAALPASAQQLTLQIHDGLVTMTASAVPVRQILAEWARVGGTKVVGAERVAGQPLTLTLEKVPEAKALDTILRGAAGYVAAARAVPGSGVSSYDRILVLATSAAPAPTAQTAARPPGRIPNAPAQDLQDSADTSAEVGNSDVPDMSIDPAQNPFAAAFAQPGMNIQPGMTQPFGQPGQVAPFGQPAQAVPFGQPTPFGQQPGQPGQVTPLGQPGAATPFGVPMAQPNGNGFFVPVQPPPDQQPPAPGIFGMPGATAPGVVQPVPQQPGVQRPRQQN